MSKKYHALLHTSENSTTARKLLDWNRTIYLISEPLLLSLSRHDGPSDQRGQQCRDYERESCSSYFRMHLALRIQKLSLKYGLKMTFVKSSSISSIPVTRHDYFDSDDFVLRDCVEEFKCQGHGSDLERSCALWQL